MRKSSPLLQWFRTHVRVPCVALLLLCFSTWTIRVKGADGSWNFDGNGNWTDGTKWTGGVPNGVGDIATIRNDITGTRTITLDQAITLGGLSINDRLGGSVFTFAGPNALTFDNTTGNAFVNKYGSATDIWQAPLVLSDSVNWNIHTGTLQVNGPSNAVVSYTGAGNTIKNGAGTLQLNIDAVSGAGYTGSWVVNFGTLAIGGANGATPTGLGTGGGITLNGNGNQGLAILSLQNNGSGTDGTATWQGNNDVILQGGARINVDRNFVGGANDRVNHVLDNLTINGGILQVNSGNSHRLTFAGTTTLVGQTIVFDVSANSTATLANLTLAGVIDDGANSRALIKEGLGRMAVTNTANTFNGVTAVKNGVLQIGSGANLGASATFVNGGVLSVPDTATLNAVSTNGLNLVGQLGTSRFSLPVIGYSSSVAIDNTNPLAANVPVSGMILGIDGVTGTSSTNSANIDLAQVGSGSQRVWLSNVLGFDRTYAGILTNGASGDLRLLAPTNNLILATTANLLGGAGATNNVVFGLDYANPILLTGNNMHNVNANVSGSTFQAGGAVSVRVNNATTLGTITVNRGVTANINGTGLTTPLGQDVVTALGGTISTDTTTDAKFGNTDFRLYGGSTLLLDNSGVTTTNSDRRLLTSTNIDLTSSTFRLLGDGGAATASSQAVNSVDYQGGSTISVESDGTTATRLTTLTVGSLNRIGLGTLNIRNMANNTATFGTASGTQKLMVTSAPTVTNGMIGAGIALWGNTTSNDGGVPLFATYDATHGVQAATTTSIANAANLAAATNTTIANIDGVAIATSGNATVQALRVRSTANTHSLTGNTITIGSAAGSGQGAGLMLAHTSNNGVTHTSNFAFGSQEGVIYAATTGGTSGSITLSGVLSGTNGVTRFGDGILILTGANTFSGPMTINSGETRVSQGASGSAAAAAGTINPLAPKEVDLWGGSFYPQTGSARYNNNINFYNDARFGNVNVANSAVNNITVQARTGSTAPVVAWIQDQAGGNFTTAYGGLTLNGPVQFSVVHPLQIIGPITGTGSIEKFMNDRLQFSADSSGYSQPITVYAGSLFGFNSTSTAKPFGTGAITINPGGTILVGAPTNVNPGQVTVKSDYGGISGIAMTYTGDPAVIPATVSSTTPWKAFLGVGGPAFDYNLDQTASGLWGGGVYLGAPLGLTGTYTGTITPTAANQFLLGAGQGAIRIAKPLTGNNSVMIGMSMTGDGGRADQTVNNGGGAVNYDVPMTYTGDTIIQTNQSLRLAANNGLDGTGDVILNGGVLRQDNGNGQLRFTRPVNVTNRIIMTADAGGVAIDDSASDFHIGGNIELAPGSTGVVRTFNVNPGQPGGAVNNAGMLYLDGGISDGVGGSGNHFVKSGAGVAMVTGPMTYTGTTTIAGGFLGINGDADLASSSQIIGTNGGLAIWENSFTTSRNYSAHGGNMIFDVAGGLTLTQAAAATIDGTNSLVKRGLGTMVLNGSNAVSGVFIGDGVLQINNQESIGDPASTSTSGFSIGGDVTSGSATAGTRYTGGTVRINFTGATNRGVVFNSNGNTGFSGGIDITAGNTFTVNGVINQGSEFDYGFRSGPGTLITTGNNTWRQFAMTNGTLQFGTSTPWANSTTTASDNTIIEMLGGTIRAVNAGANIALTNQASTTTYNYGGGMHLRMASGGAFSVEFAADNLLRANQGTLILETEGSTVLGGAGNTNAGRVVVTNAINSAVARASALTSGIFAPHIIGADANGAAFFLTDDATTGFKAYSGATAATLSGINATGIGDITSDPTLSGTNNSIYAFRTTANISGGTLRLTAIDNLREGGILINGSNTISTNLIFDPTLAGAAGTGTLAEGLVYVKTGESAVISGNITANAFTKFGDGTLTLSGNNLIAGDVSVQDGTLRLSGGNPFSRMNSELNINAGASLELNGTSIAVETLGSNNRAVSAELQQVGGQITNTAGGAAATLMVASPVNSAVSGTLNGNLKLVKAGTGVLTINGFSASTPDAGNNTYSGGTDLYGVNTTGGINLNNTTFGLGGYTGGGNPDVNLYSGTLGLLFSNGTTGVNSTQGQQFNNQSVRFGADGTDGMTVNVRGPAQINVNQATPSSSSAFGQGNLMQVGALNMTNNTLNLSGGNLYRLKVAGITTIHGVQASFQTNSDSTAIQFDGVVTGAGAINKLGDGSMRTLIFTNTGNNFSGGLNIIAGDVQNPNAAANTLGSGPVRVFPDGTLRIAGNGSVNGAKLQTLSRVNALGAIALDDNFIPTVLTSSNFSSAYNTTLQLSQPYHTQALDMATIADGRAFLGSAINTEVKYMAAALGAGVADAWNPGVGVYRVVGGVSNFGFDGVDNVLTGTSYLQVGPQRNMVLGAVTNSGNSVIIRNSNDFSGGTQVTEGTTLTVETGGSPIGETPLGTGAVEVYGSLTFQGSLGSNWKADANGGLGGATNTINLRPGGTVRLIDGNIEGVGGNLVAGDQGRWGNAAGIDLNGGIFRYDGAANWNSFETIGTVDVRKGGALQVFRSTTASSSQLTVGGLNRIAGGTLAISYNSGFLGTNLTTPMSYERLLVTGGVTRSGTTTNGATVVNGGIAPVWMIDATANTFLGYDPTGTGTGFQPLVSAAPGAGEIAYNKIASGALTAGGLVAGDIADITTAAKTLADNPTVYALRSSQNISPTASNNTMTVTSGGWIMNGGTISPTGAVTAGFVSPMTINFGAAGAGEAILYVPATTTMQAQMVAALGLTKFGGGTLNINSINPGIDGAVTLNAGTIVARVPFSGTGTPIAAGNGVFGGQDVILNGGTLHLDPFLANAAGTASEIGSGVRAMASLDSNIRVRADAGLGNNAQANYVRINDLTFENAGGATAMDGNGVIALALRSGIWVNGTTTLIPQASFNVTFDGFAQSTFAGQITQSGVSDLEKFGNGTMTLLNAGNNYTGGTTIWGTTAATASSIVASGLRGAGSPFGSGDITVNPGGLLRITDNANIASNKVYLKSDGIGLAGLGIAHNGALPTIITAGVPAAGQVKIETTGPFGGVLALDYGYYSQDLSLATIGNGDWWLGGSLSADTYYFNDTLGANSNGEYQLGGGGSQSNINFGSVLVSGSRVPLFENLFSGGTANNIRIEAGALTADLAANGPSFVNGNAGAIVLPTRNLGLVGDVRVNTNTTLALGNDFALGNGRLVLNGGNVRYDGVAPNNYITGSITIDNNVLLQSDWSTSGGNDFVITGNVAMHDGTAGGTRIWNLGGSGAMGIGLTAGSVTNGVISGANGSNLIKRGGQLVALRGNNTYEGYTQIDRGQIVIGGNVLPGVSGPLGVSNSPIILGVESTNNAGSLGIGGKFTVDRDILVPTAPGTGINLIEARTNERAVVTGGISVATGAIITLGAQSGSNATGSGGRLDITGPISGAGAVVFGTTAAATSFGGTVALLSNANGYSLNTFTGGATFNSTRVEIGGDTFFSGTAASPTIISGPFGTGAMTWTSGEAGNGPAFLAVGGPRTIINAFNATSSDTNTTFKFMGHEALTFTRNWDMHSGGTLRNRTFQVNNLYQPTTFSGNLSNSGTQGANLLKTGSGLLVLTGTNSNANIITTDGNYGTSIFIDDGILRVNGDAALGNSTTLAAAGSHLAGPADIQLRGGYLSISNGFSTARQMVLTSSNGGFDVAAGQTLTLSTATRGAQGIRKVGPGTLALNNSANTINALTLGGGQQLNPAIGFFSHTGGTVSTTATSGTPFATASATVNSGTLSLVGGGVAQALTIPTINYGASGAIALSAGGTSSTLTVSTAFARQGAFNSVNYGTLTINPSALANLGSTEKVLVTTGAPANTATGGGNILTVPSIFVRLAAANSDANFARYDATNGLMVHSVGTVATLGASSSANVADITVADVAGAGNVDIQALRTSANIIPADGTTLVRIARGGLIINTASTISAPLLFGTDVGASLTEAIVYARENTSGYSVIEGGIVARDFTKTGPGVLEIGSLANSLNTNAARLPVLSVQDGTLRFASAGAQFTNPLRSAAVVSATGSYVLNVNESGVFDLNGIDTTVVGGLTGNGTVTSNGPASGIALVVQNGFGVDPTFSGLISNGTATSLSLTKRGNGILTLNGHGSYTGGTIVEAGRVTNATGSTVALGRLEAQTVTALGTGPITLRGGDLRLNGATLLDGAQTTNEVSVGIDGLLWGGPNGYNITVASTASTNGVVLPANTTSVLRAATQNAIINNLTVDAPILTSTEGIVLVQGTSTFSQDNTVLRTAGGGRLFLQGQVNAAGKTITKTGYNGTVGVGELVVTNTESGASQNDVGLWKVYGGILNPRSADGAANPLGVNPTVEINGGSTNYGLLLTTDGDGTGAAERVMTYADTTVRFGSDLAVSSNEFVMSGNGRLMVDRVLGNNDEKTVVIGSLQIRGALGSPSTLFTNGNRANVWVEGTTDFQRDWQLEVNPGLDTAVTFNGVVSGNGTVSRKGYSGSVLFNNVNTWNGGLFITGGGNTLLGSLEGNQVTLSTTAKFGTGHVFLGPLSTLQINAAGNLRPDQNFYVSGNLSFAAPFSLAADLPLDQVRLRSAGLGGIQTSSAAGNPTSANYYLSNPNPSSSVLALGSIYTQALDQRAIGDGMWFIGSATNMVGANGSYDAATLAPGLDNIYRLGGGGATLFFGSNGNANVLTDTDPTALANLIVGAPMTIQNGSVWSGGNGTVVLLQNQNYTGSTLVNRSSTLDFRGTLATSGIEAYGVVNVAGEAGTFINPVTSTNIPVTLRPGSTLRFDNTSAGVLPVTAAQGRWQDTAGITMNNAIVRLQGSPAVEVAETVGAITANLGSNQIQFARGMIGRGTELRTPGITRVGNSTVQLTHNSSQLGTDERLIVTGTAPTVTNGMVAPWMISASDNQFLTYNADTGYTIAGFDRLQNGGTSSGTLNFANERVFFTSAATVIGNGFDISGYAMRLDQNVTLATLTNDTTSANRLIIGSGGLISNGARTITAGIWAGAAGTSELLLYNNNTTIIGDAANFGTAGQIRASGITKFGAGLLQFLGNNTGFTGDIRIQQGTVEFNYTQTSAANPTNVAMGGNGGNIILQGDSVTLNLRGGNDLFTGDNLTFNNSIVLGDYVPIATVNIDRAGGSITNKTMVLNNLTFGLSNNDVGQMFRTLGNSNTGFDLRFTGTTTLNGRSAFMVDNSYNSSASDLFLDGQVTGTGTLIKGPVDSRGRELNLRNVASLNNWTAGTVLQGGTLRVFAKAPNVATNASTDLTFGGISTGDITLMQGLLDLRLDNDQGGAADTNLERVVYADTGTMGPNVFLNGSSVINVDRTGLVAAGTTKQIVLGNLTMGQQWLTVTGGNSYSLEFGGTTTLLGSPYINNSADLTLNGPITTDGGGVIFNKVNTGTLWINSANPALTANIYLNAGLLAFGNRLTSNNAANLGVGDIFVNPGASIHVRTTANINTAAGQQVVLTGTPYSASVFRSVGAFTQTEYQNLIVSGASNSNQVAVIALEATNNNALDFSSIGNGRLYLGANGDRTYGAASLLPGLANLPNSVVGGGSTNPVYRLTHTSANTLTINLSAGGLGDAGGSTDVQIGNLATLGTSNQGSTGYVYFQDQNTYTGQTVVSRGMTLRFNVGMAALDAAGPLGVGSGGSGLVDVYGGLRIENGGSVRNNEGTAQYYTNIKLRPGSVLTFQDMTAGGNRWDDGTPINLDGSTLVGEPTNDVANNTETVGALTFDRGSRIQTVQGGTGDVFFTAASLTRAAGSAGAGTGRGTLVFVPADSARFGLAGTAGDDEHQVIFTNTPTVSATSAVANMLPGYYMDGTAHRFVTYGAAGAVGVAPVGDSSMVAMPTGAGAGTEVVNITANTTMGSFATSIYALRGGGFTLSSPTGANNDATITLGGSLTDVGAVASFGAFIINPNLKFGANGTNEALFYTGGTLTVNGNITAGAITKFGVGGTMVVANDQSDAARGTGNGYSNGWVVNEGALQFGQFGSAGNAVASNSIVLNGAQNVSQLNLRAQPADTLLNYTYTSGKIYAVDNAIIDWDPGADDRVHTIADIEIQQSGGIGNGPDNGTVDAMLRVANNRSRSILAAGTLTMASNAILQVDTTATAANFTAASTNGAYLTNSLSSGMSVASLSGTNRLTKWGDGTLYVRGDSPNFTGTVVIDEGPVFVTHNRSLGTGDLIINRYGTLEIGVANFVAQNASVTYNEGSMERWSVDSARSGSLNLGPATLQIAANQPTTNAAITLNGGGIQAFLRGDDLSGAQSSGGVLRILNPNVTVNLAGNSFIGDRYFEGANGLDSGKQTNDNRPMEEYLASGALLEVQGIISGVGGLTKVGYDTIILSGQNAYQGSTVVTGGKLMIGADDSLPATTTLSTTANGVLDLNGQNQTVGALTNVVAATNVNSTSGFITNSGTAVKTLTVGNGVSSNFAYAGVIQHNVALTKTGSAAMTLHNANTYTGATTVGGGTLALGLNASIHDSPWINIAGAAAIFDVSAKTGGYTFDGRVSGGGTDTAGKTFATVANAARISGKLIIGDHQGEISGIGSMAPGANSVPGALATAGDQIGHIYTNSDLTLSGPLAGTLATPETRLTLQLNGATTNIMDLGFAIGSDLGQFLDANPDYLNGTSGNLTVHDYVNVGGELALNQYGRIGVDFYGSYTPGFGDLFNLLDWSTIVTNGFDAGPTQRTGAESGYDLDLPALNSGMLWDTSRFLSAGVIIVVPEPSRLLLLFFGLLGVFFRRRRTA